MARNKVEYFGETLIDLTDTTAVASDVAQGKYFYGADGVKTLGTSSGGGSEPELIASTTVAASTTSTSVTTLTTLSLGSRAWTSDKVIYVKVRDEDGRKNGYFYGSDSYYINYIAANGETTTLTLSSGIRINLTSAGKWVVHGGNYGIYPTALTSAGELTISVRYSDTYSRIIDGTYLIDVYLVNYPAGNPFESDIPSEYERVTSIGGSTTAYIDTGIELDGSVDWQVDLLLPEGSTSFYPINAHRSTSARMGGSFNASLRRFYYYWTGVTYATHNIASSIDLTARLTITQDKDGMTITQGSNTSSVTYSGTTATESSRHIWLFRTQQNTNGGLGYIYSAKINKNGETLRDFVPVRRKADSVLGMYDKIEGQFYTALGGGEFVVGE